MTTDELLREIRKAAKTRGLALGPVREGKAHRILRVDRVQFAIPRHRQIGPKMAFEIRGQLEPVLGKRWWR